MTILQPNKKKPNVKLFTISAVAVVLLWAYFSIIFYNDVVDLRHTIGAQEKLVDNLQVDNAELKNKLYLTLDVNNVAGLASESGLILDKNPGYLESKASELAQKQ